MSEFVPSEAKKLHSEKTSRDLADNVFERTIPYPRLTTPIRLADHLSFVAEHDDYHLALGTGHNKTVDSPD